MAGKFEPYTSLYVVAEIDSAPREKRDNMMALIARYNITVLAASDEADNLARRYVAEGALPLGSLSDASHVTASVNALDMINSLNFWHIVREKTIKLTGAINTLLGYPAVELNAPMEVIDEEKTRYHLGRSSCDTPHD
ncbi:MAG: hypothetical protein FWD57_13005 [Polyangiaceae bacterium]|nr:hypothetical protein [Polyangiaceae bacterium]